MQIVRLAALAAALVVAASATASAQGGAGAPPQAGQMQQGMRRNMMEMLFKGITLTDEQKATVEKIMADSREEMAKLGNPRDLDDAGRAKRRELQQKQQDDLRAVLTKEQQEQFGKNLEEMRATMGRRGGPPGV